MLHCIVTTKHVLQGAENEWPMSLVTSHTCWRVKHVQKMVSALVYMSHLEQDACLRRILVHRERTALEDPHRDVLALMVDFMLLKYSCRLTQTSTDGLLVNLNVITGPVKARIAWECWKRFGYATLRNSSTVPRYRTLVSHKHHRFLQANMESTCESSEILLQSQAQDSHQLSCKDRAYQPAVSHAIA